MVGPYNHFPCLHLDGLGRNISIGVDYLVRAGTDDARTKATQTHCVVRAEQLVGVSGPFGQQSSRMVTVAYLFHYFGIVRAECDDNLHIEIDHCVHVARLRRANRYNSRNYWIWIAHRQVDLDILTSIWRHIFYPWMISLFLSSSSGLQVVAKSTTIGSRTIIQRIEFCSICTIIQRHLYHQWRICSMCATANVYYCWIEYLCWAKRWTVFSRCLVIFWWIH